MQSSAEAVGLLTRAAAKPKGASPSHGRSARKRGLRGDLAVRRVRGSGGVKAKQDRVLRSLGLYSAGQISWGFADEPAFIGQIAKVPHHLEVIPVTAGAYEFVQGNKTIARSSFDVSSAQSGRVMSKQRYDVADSDMIGELITLEDGEFIQCEQGVGCFSLLWSSAMPIETAYARASAIINERDKLKTGFVCFADGGVVEGSSAEVGRAMRSSSSKVDLLRVDGDRLAFAWTARVGHLDGRRIEMHECSIVSRDIDLAFLAKFVKASSTIQLGSQAKDLVMELSPIMRGSNETAVIPE